MRSFTPNCKKNGAILWYPEVAASGGHDSAVRMSGRPYKYGTKLLLVHAVEINIYSFHNTTKLTKI